MNITLKPKAPATLAQALRRGALRAVVLVAALVLGYSVSLLAQGGQPGLVFPEAPAAPARDLPPAPGSPAALMEANDCWNGEAPADVEVPGHVVIRYDGEVAAQYRGSKHVGVALDHLFGTPNPDVAEVYGFCR